MRFSLSISLLAYALSVSAAPLEERNTCSTISTTDAAAVKKAFADAKIIPQAVNANIESNFPTVKVSAAYGANQANLGNTFTTLSMYSLHVLYSHIATEPLRQLTPHQTQLRPRRSRSRLSQATAQRRRSIWSSWWTLMPPVQPRAAAQHYLASSCTPRFTINSRTVSLLKAR